MGTEGVLVSDLGLLDGTLSSFRGDFAATCLGDFAGAPGVLPGDDITVYLNL
jgi:hypothetical protein